MHGLSLFLPYVGYKSVPPSVRYPCEMKKKRSLSNRLLHLIANLTNSLISLFKCEILVIWKFKR